jgi:uncharacterized protein YndB with AHSA1/START domain
MEKVWDAITDIELMKQWFFTNIPAFEPTVGFETQFVVESGDRTFTHLWRIDHVTNQKVIIYNWKYKEYEGDGRVTFELFKTDRGVLLRVTNEGLESFPQNIPEFSRENCEAGWKYFINESLRELLE